MTQRRREWQFFQDDRDQWTWRVHHPDGHSMMSRGTFASLVNCVAAAINHGYVLLPSFDDRRFDRRRGPDAVIAQEVTCPHCRHNWELGRGQFVACDDVVHCAPCNADFNATPANVTCCVQEADGLRELPLPRS